MKAFRILAVFTALAACGRAPNPGETLQLDKGTSALRIEVAGVRSNKGTLGCSLHIDGEQFPGASRIIGGGQEHLANGGSVMCAWDELPAGTYAISVFHDENDNGKLDTNIVGAPVEGYGVTNNITYPMGPPKFDESKFDVAAGATASKQITLKY
jgi:uncharacterized protein (DUF2141 family)